MLAGYQSYQSNFTSQKIFQKPRAAPPNEPSQEIVVPIRELSFSHLFNLTECKLRQPRYSHSTYNSNKNNNKYNNKYNNRLHRSNPNVLNGNESKNKLTLTPETLRRIYKQPPKRSNSCNDTHKIKETPVTLKKSDNHASKPPIKRSYSEADRVGENTREDQIIDIAKADLENLNRSIQDLINEQSVTNKNFCIRNDDINFNMFLDEGWQQIIHDLDTAGKLDSKLLEAIYLLRNAHRKGFFSQYEDTKASTEEVKQNGTFARDDLTASTDSLGSASLSSNILCNSTTTDSSSGRSTPSFRKRPKRPDIKITEHKEYVEIRRFDSVSSLASDTGSVGADCVDIPDEVFAKAIFSSEYNKQNNHLGNHIHEFEETLRHDTPIPKSKTETEVDEVDSVAIEKICLSRPESPTAKFLEPIIKGNQRNITSELISRLSPLLHRLTALEEQNKKISSMQVKIAVLQEEKRQLTSMLKQKRNSEESSLTPSNEHKTSTKQEGSSQRNVSSHLDKSDIVITDITTEEYVKNLKSEKTFKDKGVQKYLELYTEIAHKQTSAEDFMNGIQRNEVSQAEVIYSNKLNQAKPNYKDSNCQVNSKPICSDKNIGTLNGLFVDKAIGENRAEKNYTSKSCQFMTSNSDTETQTVIRRSNQNTMVGASVNHMVDSEVGDGNAEIITSNESSQTETIQTNNQESQCASVKTKTRSTTCGSSFNSLKSVASQHNTLCLDFSCGDFIAEIVTENVATHCIPQTEDHGTNPLPIDTKDFGCSMVPKISDVGVGDTDVHHIVCDLCQNKRSRDFACGTYVNLEPCCIDDKLCDCVKPLQKTIGIGSHTIHDNFCDKCDNLKTKSIAVGEDKITDLLCDRCLNLTVHDTGVGDCRIDDVLCHKCSKSGNCIDTGVGDSDVNKNPCEKCNQNENAQKPVLCNYCGNKVDLEDENLDANLQAMRESMNNLSSGMRRSSLKSNLNLALELEQESCSSSTKGRKNSLESPSYNAQQMPLEDFESAADNDFPVALSDEEDIQESGRNDVIEACKMLHAHFSGEKPLNKINVLKYMGIIQALWFKTVKKRRANASVVKSYLDLFQQRIPELLETIVNMTDDDANTALHYALTYKNFPVVSIMLDSGECAVNMVNQAGYSPIMLAALAGFERKNDKYIMQRLIRMGDINKVSADTGQTPLMLAVSRGNAGVVDILLDAGCDINMVDDEGSTALMCACEHGNISIVKTLLGNPECDATIEDNEGSTALSIAMDSRRKDLALLIYGSLNFDTRGRIKLSPSKQSLLGLGRRSPSPVRKW